MKPKVTFSEKTNLVFHDVHSDNIENMTTTKGNAGRRGYEYETEMEKYRAWFTTGTLATRYRNAGKLRIYCEWIKKTPEQLIAEYSEARKDVSAYNIWKRDVRTKILEFYGYLKARGYKVNYCRTQPLGVLAFYSAHAETVKDATKEFDSVQIPENEFVFTQEDLRKMFFYADAQDKALISLAKNLISKTLSNALQGD